MSKVFSSPKSKPVVVPPVETPPVPTRSDAETASLAEEQRKRFTAKSGRASTFLTGAGVSDGSTAVRFLGGAAAT